MNGEDRALHVPIEGVVKLFFRDGAERRHRSAAGIHEEHVDPAKALLHFGEKTIEVGQAGGIGANADHSLPDPAGRLIELFLAAPGDDHLGAVGGETLRGRKSDAGRTAGHDNDLVFQLLAHAMPPAVDGNPPHCTSGPLFIKLA